MPGRSEPVGAERSHKPSDTAWLTADPVPLWIWDAAGPRNGQRLFFRKAFDLPAPVRSAKLYTTCDNRMQLWINGRPAGSSRDWPYPIQKDVAPWLRQGKNVIAVEGQNRGGTAAWVLKLVVDLQDGRQQIVISDLSWKMQRDAAADGWYRPEFDDSGWRQPLRSMGPLGTSPWQVPGNRRTAGKAAPAGSGSAARLLDPADITVPAGFRAELVFAVERATQGSWVSLAKDPKGRFYACDQGDKGLWRITVSRGSGERDVRVEAVPVTDPRHPGKPLSGAQGLAWAQDSLWFHQNGGSLFRLVDSDGDDVLDRAEPMPSATGGGEHGNHAVVPTEDGRQLYVQAGNATPPPPISTSRIRSWEEDLLLPRLWDPRGHARGRMAPGGWTARFDPQTKTYDLYCIGFRNAYDLAANRFGDLFTYDADMEWDMGLPWYRPTRICMVASGVDYGWRSGSGKWPSYYEDSLPPIVEVGPGSPTGVVAGTQARFPARYRDAIFALDWTFGTIYAIHLRPQGAGYTGVLEPFAYGSPLPLTDAVIGDDGALYFTTGGRGMQSGLYRIRYVGPLPVDQPPAAAAAEHQATAARALRRRLESLHGRRDPQAVELAWPQLASADRFLRYAARVAIESQPVEWWADRVFAERNPQARITGAVALARVGKAEHRAPLLDALLQLDPAALPLGQQLGLLRAYALTFIRLGKPTDSERQRVIADLDPLLPADDPDLNMELIRLLVYLEAPGIVEKTLRLIERDDPPQLPDWAELIRRNARYGGVIAQMLKNPPPTRQLGYAFLLRNVRHGWTLDQRRRYFTFLNRAARCSGGASYPGYLRNMREDALSLCTDAERTALADVTGEDFDPVPDFPIHPPRGPGRTWTVPQALQLAASRLAGADFQSGRNLFFAAHCGKCHRFAGLGGSIGPDLTSIRNKFDVQYLVESIIEPSKVISDQYQSSVVVLDDGRTLTGLVAPDGDQWVIYPADVEAEPVKVAREHVELLQPSPISQMPQGLVDPLSPKELRDLLAYLMSGGRPDDRVYGKRKKGKAKKTE